MTQRLAAGELERKSLAMFLASLEAQDLKICACDELLRTWEPVALTHQELIDRHQEIDREQLAAERSAQLQPGAECPCDS
jgi:hypothetical protein